MSSQINFLPPLIIMRGAEFIYCAVDSDIESWLTHDVMRNANAFVIRDPDGSLWSRYAGTFSNHQYVPKALNVPKIRLSARYNPFEYVNDNYDVHKLAAAIMSGTKGLGKPGDINFLSGEAMLLTALISYAHLEAPDYERNIGILIEILKYMMPDDYEEGFVTAVDLVFEDIARAVPEHESARLYFTFKDTVGEDAIHIAASCAARLAPFNTPEMLDFISKDELRLDNLTFPNTALFVIGNHEAECGFLIPLMYSQLFDMLYRKRV